jgi:uncharacterized protein
MLLIPSLIQNSPLHGLGCFAATTIAKDSVVWMFSESVDTVYHSPPPRRQRKRSYKSVTQEKTWVLPMDNAAFINFSDTPNLRMSHSNSYVEPALIAKHDIYSGEELTVGPETDGDYAVKMTWRD